MVVQDVQGGGGLAHGDEFLSPLCDPSQSSSAMALDEEIYTHLENILGLDMRWRGHGGGPVSVGSLSGSPGNSINRYQADEPTIKHLANR